MYGYCGNNPILFVDENGEIFFLVTAAVGAVIGGIGGAIYSQVKYGEVRWQNIAAGAAVGGVVGATGGAVTAYAATGNAAATYSSVVYAGANWAATSAATGATTSYAIGATFEKWFYNFYNIDKSFQQVVVKGVGRIDAFSNGTIYELKNYNWTKYSSGQLDSIIKNFTKQAQKYMGISNVNGEKVKDIVYYFSSKPPEKIINSLIDIGAKVQWVPK